MLSELNIWDASPKNIWNFKQNHPELVIEDIENDEIVKKLLDSTINYSHNISLVNHIKSLVRQSMLCRGINKWLKVRRDIIAYKKQIRHQILDLNNKIIKLKREMTENYITIDFNNKVISIEDFFKFQKYKNIQIEYLIAKELLKEKQKVRSTLKSLCMTNRWQLWIDETGKPIHLKKMNTISCSDK